MLHHYCVKKYSRMCLCRLAELQNILFQFYLDKQYQIDPASFEIKLFYKKKQYFSAMQRARHYFKTPAEKKILTCIERLSDALFSLHQLRFRLNDLTLYTMCTLELTALARDISKLLLGFAVHNTQAMALENFLTHIHAFETIAHRTLNVIVKDPMIFLFFIQDLYAVYDAFQVIGLLDNVNHKQ